MLLITTLQILYYEIRKNAKKKPYLRASIFKKMRQHALSNKIYKKGIET